MNFPCRIPAQPNELSCGYLAFRILRFGQDLIMNIPVQLSDFGLRSRIYVS